MEHNVHFIHTGFAFEFACFCLLLFCMYLVLEQKLNNVISTVINGDLTIQSQVCVYSTVGNQ